MTVGTATATRHWGSRVVAFWVRRYTSGLPEAVRYERRDEIASDLWEHEHDLDGSSVGPEILARGLLGVPADLAWRLERSRLARMPGWGVTTVLGLLARFEATGRWIARRGLPGFTSATAVIVGLLGVVVIATAPSNDSGTPTSDLVFWGAMLIVAAVTVGLGGRLINVHTRLGGALVILGSGLFGLFLWPTIVGPIAALGLAWRAVLRIRDARRSGAAVRHLD